MPPYRSVIRACCSASLAFPTQKSSSNILTYLCQTETSSFALIPKNNLRQIVFQRGWHMFRDCPRLTTWLGTSKPRSGCRNRAKSNWVDIPDSWTQHALQLSLPLPVGDRTRDTSPKYQPSGMTSNPSGVRLVRDKWRRAERLSENDQDCAYGRVALRRLWKMMKALNPYSLNRLAPAVQMAASRSQLLAYWEWMTRCPLAIQFVCRKHMDFCPKNCPQVWIRLPPCRRPKKVGTTLVVCGNENCRRSY